ncbi:hypothetical protein PABG_05114 [Paracoccidioides brasiliensis Pb03]|nr:hypothetical protein PABG_05114 [Paracoccidioides brasiliensis Pb03]ODH36492.1 hypothetical protein ACO22_02775 [Paracoccidioides brasiliensis]ODH47090.1 hypothetical protein GX48_06803 [Paracoccidioides brasiliensis]
MAEHQFKKSPFAYTSGRWLHLDKLQREARYIQFNFDCLCDKVLSLCPSATSIQSYQKLEGGFNRAFIFTTDDGRRVVAKFPTSVAGSARFVTNSEVATITYLQHHLKIPIPTILDWCDDPSNPIGSAYIIMEHAGGISLYQMWPKMSFSQRMNCIRSISTGIMKMSELNFPGYGSLYFTDAVFLDADLKQKLDGDCKYCIGPNCRNTYWDCNVGEPRNYALKGPNRGPWSDLLSYSSALIDVGLARLPPAENLAPHQQPSYKGSVGEHLELLSLGQALFPILTRHPQIQSNAAPTLFHSDLHKRNIFVSEDDPTIVTGFIDWQSTSIEPAFYYADEVPDFAKPPVNETPESIEESICSQAFEEELGLLAPRLAAVRKIDETLLRPFRCCHRTWKDGLVSFTHELMQLREHWQDLGFEEDCPIPALSLEEMRIHQERLDIYDKMSGVRQDIVEMLGVGQHGWIPEYRWEEVKETHQRIYKAVLATTESEKDRQEIKMMWPFDVIEA